MRLLLLLPILLLMGCVTSRPVSLPNGTKGIAVNCPGMARDIADCMNEAAKVCGGKYEILTREGLVAGGATTQVGNSALYVQGVKRTLIVHCENSP
jgi:hypothetical protein